jgi:hypothetical protein
VMSKVAKLVPTLADRCCHGFLSMAFIYSRPVSVTSRVTKPVWRRVRMTTVDCIDKE